MKRNAAVSVQKLTAAIGAEVRGIDLRDRLDEATIAEIHQLLMDNVLLVLPDQPVTNADLARFGRYFGPLVEPAIQTKFGDSQYPELIVLDQTDPRGAGAEQWHADSTFLAIPPQALILRTVQMPSVGGDTCFASMYAAYDALSDPMKTHLEGLHAVHSIAKMSALTKNFGYISKNQDETVVPPVVHPVIRVHPETGKKLLNVNANYTTEIIELAPAESKSLLDFLLQHLQAVEFQCRVRWQPNTVAILDNRAAQHCAIPDYRERRVIIRLMVHGAPEVAA